MKIFDKWELDEVEINDPSIENYVTLSPMIHTGGRHAGQQFNKSKISIVERLINKMMKGEHNTGKKQKTSKIVMNAFDIIYEKTKENPVQVLIRAIENAGQREEIVRLKFGGIAVPKAVDTAPQRRVDAALKYITNGAKKAAFKSRRPIADCLASEIIAASNYEVRSFSINRKEEKERIAKSAR
ncbi:MAG: 30S ribosomal protein S7 [Halobacteriota archaeon]|nr:30S ribosomal protein S7 [Halobacteriota archaeon]